MHNLLQIIKKSAVEAVEASNPTKVMYGTVTAVSPLSIKIDQRFTVTESFLVLTKNVRDYEVEVTVEWTTEEKSGGSGDDGFASHNHEIKDKKKMIIHNALKTGDKVILLREQGGQKYIVIDKVGD